MLQSQRSGLSCIWHRRLFSEDCRSRPLLGRQHLPCPVRLKLPPSQSAFELQLCFPLSCCKQKTEVRLWTWRWNVDVKRSGKQHNNMWNNFSIDCSCLQPILTALYVILTPLCLKGLFFFCNTAKKKTAANYRNSLGMRHNFRFVLLFMVVYKSEWNREKVRRKKSQKKSFHIPLDTFPSSVLQLWCSLS